MFKDTKLGILNLGAFADKSVLFSGPTIHELHALQIRLLETETKCRFLL